MHLIGVACSQDHWPLYQRVMEEAHRRGIVFAIGGGLAVEAYTAHRESTKDIDFYVLPQERDRMVAVVTEFGLADLYDKLPYDRKWIYRSFTGDVIVDIMWAMPNQRAQVDIEWLSRARDKSLHGMAIRVLPPEELIWAKLYVMQRDRCDWPDVLNLIYATSGELDWDHLLRRIGDDAPLLKAVLTIFHWLSPDRAQQMPPEVLQTLEERSKRSAAPSPDLLDTRPWFIPALKPAQ